MIGGRRGGGGRVECQSQGGEEGERRESGHEHTCTHIPIQTQVIALEEEDVELK